MKKLYADGINYVAGGTTQWYIYKDFKVQGTYELRSCLIFDKLKENKEIVDWEYTSDKYKYIGPDEKEHTYLLDFKITGNTNNVYYVEVKGRIKDNDEFKWKTVRDLGYILDVWFIDEIKTQEKKLNIEKEWEKILYPKDE